MKKVFALVLALALVMCGFTACSGKNGGSDTKTDADLTKVGEYTANNTEYVIGATGPLTGDASSYGNSVRNGAQLAVDEINAAGGLNGVNFKFDMKDDKPAPLRQVRASPPCLRAACRSPSAPLPPHPARLSAPQLLSTASSS